MVLKVVPSKIDGMLLMILCLCMLVLISEDRCMMGSSRLVGYVWLYSMVMVMYMLLLVVVMWYMGIGLINVIYIDYGRCCIMIICIVGMMIDY